MSSNQYCRLCGACNEELTDIFMETDTSIHILFKIRIVLCISISKDDEFSHQICSSCVAKVQEYYLFTKKCQEMQFRLFETNTDCSVVSIWKMEIDDCDVQLDYLDDIKVVNYDAVGAVKCSVEKKELLLESEMNESIDENNTPLSQNDVSIVQIDENDAPSSNDETSLVQKSDSPTESCSVSAKSTQKISYSKLAAFFRSKVKIRMRTRKETPSSSDAQKHSSKNVVSCSENVLNDTGNVEVPVTEEVDLDATGGYTIEEIIDPKAPQCVSSVTLFRSNVPKGNSGFKKKILILKGTKTDSSNRPKRKKDENSVKCPYCGEIFPRDEFEQEHMALHTDDPDLHKIILDHVSPLPTSRQLDCEECKISFNRELAYIEHMNQHSDLRPVKCHICDRHFYGHKRTRSHFRSAHLVNSFKCESCPYMAKTLSDLEKHRRGVHLNDRIMCNICGKLLSAFTHNMKKHLETHNETRPYKCEYCDASFKTSASVSRHRENMHFPQSVMCSSCGTVCKSKQKYKKHAYKCKRKLKKINL